MPPESLPRSALLRPAKRLQYVCFSVRSRLWDHGLPSFLFKQKLLSEANSFALPILRKRFSRTPRAKATGHIEYANMQCWASASPSTFYFFKDLAFIIVNSKSNVHPFFSMFPYRLCSSASFLLWRISPVLSNPRRHSPLPSFRLNAC